jgi:hypothetical protein
LIDGHVGAAHHARGVLERDVELVAHDLPERRAGSLPEIGFADEEGRRVIRPNHDPRIQLAEVGVRIRAGSLRRRTKVRPYIFEGDRTDRSNQEARRLDEFTPGLHAGLLVSPPYSRPP